MNTFRFLTAVLLLASLTGCGVDKFFIERGVNKIAADVENQLNEFASLNADQQAQAKQIGLAAERWTHQVLLPRAANLIGQVAQDIELTGALQKNTYDAIVEFAYQPIALSQNHELIQEVARLFYSMDERQDEEVRAHLSESYIKRRDKRDERTLEKQKDGIAKSLKTLFRGMGVARERTELDRMREVLEARIDLGEQTNAFYTQTNEAFMALTEEKGRDFDLFLQRYKEAWALLEAGPNSAHPEQFKYNADNGFAALKILFDSLNADEQIKAVGVLREYQDFLLGLSVDSE